MKLCWEVIWQGVWRGVTCQNMSTTGNPHTPSPSPKALFFFAQTHLRKSAPSTCHSIWGNSRVHPSTRLITSSPALLAPPPLPFFSFHSFRPQRVLSALGLNVVFRVHSGLKSTFFFTHHTLRGHFPSKARCYCLDCTFFYLETTSKTKVGCLVTG